MSEKEIEDIKKKYFKKIDVFLEELKNSLHSKIFHEEFDFMYDSIQDSSDRKNGINPMTENYTSKVNLKREKLKVSKLGNDGQPIDNSSEIFIENLVSDYLIEDANSRNKKLIKGMDISSFLKNSSKQQVLSIEKQKRLETLI